MHDIEEARLQAGFFIGECLELFGISKRTWYRWRERGAPEWAFKLLRLQAGYLEPLGWKHWQIRRGVLYFDGFTKPYKWEPGELIAYAWIRQYRNMPPAALPKPNNPFATVWTSTGPFASLPEIGQPPTTARKPPCKA